MSGNTKLSNADGHIGDENEDISSKEGAMSSFQPLAVQKLIS